MAPKTNDKFDFEASLNKLEKLVEKMAGGNLNLEDSLKQFEEGIALVRGCQQALQTAEQKVHKLMEKNGELQLQPYHDEDEKP